MKIKETTMLCPFTGEYYKKRELVPSTDEKTENALKRHRETHEQAIDRQAASEAIHMRRRRIMQAKQKIGF
jgi:hypothetical protein